jgi:hypothetical protein
MREDLLRAQFGNLTEPLAGLNQPPLTGKNPAYESRRAASVAEIAAAKLFTLGTVRIDS